MMSDTAPLQIVEEFLTAFAAMDVDATLTHLEADVEYTKPGAA